MSDIKDKLKAKSLFRQPVPQVNLLEEKTEDTSDRPTDRSDTISTIRPSLKYEDRPERESVRRSYQFFLDQDKKLKKIQAYYSKKKGKQIPLSFFTKRAFDEYIARCFDKINEEGGDI